MNEIQIIPVAGVGEIMPGDDLGAALAEAAGPEAFRDTDVLVVAQKVVSKAEDRAVPSADREKAVQSEATRILRRSNGLVIAETRHGFVCANAGVDASNMPADQVLLLPLDPDLSARRLKARLKSLTSVDVAVIVSDTFGRAWRLGQTNIAIGVAGIEPFTDYRGALDRYGRELHATRICTADEIAGAAELVMGKSEGICAAIVRGAHVRAGRGAASEIVRPVTQDLFR